jgi:hypothetical protein
MILAINSATYVHWHIPNGMHMHECYKQRRLLYKTNKYFIQIKTIQATTTLAQTSFYIFKLIFKLRSTTEQTAKLKANSWDYVLTTLITTFKILK